MNTQSCTRKYKCTESKIAVEKSRSVEPQQQREHICSLYRTKSSPSLGGLREIGWGILAPWRRDQRSPNPHTVCAGRADAEKCQTPDALPVTRKGRQVRPTPAEHARINRIASLQSSAQAAVTQSDHSSECVNGSTPTCGAEPSLDPRNMTASQTATKRYVPIRVKRN